MSARSGVGNDAETDPDFAPPQEIAGKRKDRMSYVIQGRVRPNRATSLESADDTVGLCVHHSHRGGYKETSHLRLPVSAIQGSRATSLPMKNRFVRTSSVVNWPVLCRSLDRLHFTERNHVTDPT